MFIDKLPGFKCYFMAEGGDSGGGGDAGAGAGGGDAGAGAGAGGGDKGGDQGGASNANQFSLPEAYKDAPWAKDFKSADDVFKSLENAQQFIGRKGFGVPGEKATAEDKAAFYAELGVPPDAKGYDFKRPEGVPDELWNSEHESKWAGLMKQHNVPKSVANELRNEMLKETIETYNEQTKSLNEAMDKSFGDKKTEVAKQVGELMKKAVPDAALRQQIEAGIGNKNLPAFALGLGLAMQHMNKTYGQADTTTNDDGGASGKTIPELRAEAAALQASKPYTDVMHKDHASTRKTVDQMYADIGRLTDEAKKVK